MDSLYENYTYISGRCGVSDGKQGSVVFVIKLDGKEIWRSKKTQEGALREFSIDVSKANLLELITEDAGDGTGSDWGLWLEPILSR